MKNPFAVFRLDRKIKLMAAKGKGRFGPRGGPGGSGGRGCSRSPGSAPRLQWRGAPAWRRCPPAERRGRSRGPSPERARGSGECGPQGSGCGLQGESPAAGQGQPHLAEAPERRGELPAPERRRRWQLGAAPAVPSRAGEWGGTAGLPRTSRVLPAGREHPELSRGVTFPRSLGAGGGFSSARHSLEGLRKPGKLLLWLKDGSLQSSLAPWPPQGRGLTQKDVLTAEFPPQNLLIKGSERLSKSMLRRT